MHRNDLPPFRERVPYVAAVVDLEEGPRMMTNVVDCEFDALDDRHGARGGVPPDVGRGDDRPVPARRLSAWPTPDGREWSFPFEEPLHEVFPALHDAQSSWLSQIDSLAGAGPQDPRAHPARLHRDPAQPGRASVRHAQLAPRSAPTWDEVLGSIMLTVPAFGMLAAVEAMPARARGVRRRPTARGRLTMADAERPKPSVPFRILPRLTDLNRGFWTGGETASCASCAARTAATTTTRRRRSARCCHSKHLESEAVSGRATLCTYSVNHQPWMPGPELPFVVAIVAIPEQDGLRLTTNLVDFEPDDVRDRHAARGHVRAPRRRGVDPAVPPGGGS